VRVRRRKRSKSVSLSCPRVCYDAFSLVLSFQNCITSFRSVISSWTFVASPQFPNGLAEMGLLQWAPVVRNSRHVMFSPSRLPAGSEGRPL